MKTSKFILIVFGSSMLLYTSCDKSPAVETPDYGLYKTTNDYFGFYSPQINTKGQVISTPYFQENDSRIKITDSDTVYALRVELSDGYILSAEVDPDAIFSDVTFKEILQKQNTDDRITSTILSDRIIDRNPFTEYYRVESKFVEDEGVLGVQKWQAVLNAAERINMIIEEGRLEEEFSRVK